MKGIILAGGLGTRLYPITLSTSKQLLPVYDKPMIYYPLAVLMQGGIREILLITTAQDLSRFSDLLGDGSHLGITITYAVQTAPKGIAEALIIAEPFIAGSPVCLILGDNLFHGDRLPALLSRCAQLETGAIILGYEVEDPERYGVLAFDEEGRIEAIVEKPSNPPSAFAVPGLYFYDGQAPYLAKQLTPSSRGELEITDLANLYLEQGTLSVELLERGFAWLDTGTVSALQSASIYVETMQKRQGIKIGCVEEIAYRQGWITDEGLGALITRYGPSDYAGYLRKLLMAQALS